jgi:hypothetical protein
MDTGVLGARATHTDAFQRPSSMSKGAAHERRRRINTLARGRGSSLQSAAAAAIRTSITALVLRPLF